MHLLLCKKISLCVYTYVCVLWDFAVILILLLKIKIICNEWFSYSDMHTGPIIFQM